MNIVKHAVVAVALMLAVPAYADLKVAVLDAQAALWASEDAKKAIEKFKGDIKVQQESMSSLKKELDELQARFQKDGSVMAEKDKKALQEKADSKFRQYQALAQAVQEKNQKMQQEVINALAPKMEKAIDDIQKASAYDLILNKKEVLFALPALDITKKVTEKLNQTK